MFCPKCGSENQETNKFCKKCGRQLPNRGQGGQGVSQSFAHPHQPSLYGQVLDGKYRIEAKLGSGGMGDVYRATRLLIGDSVAIKILHPHLAIDPQAAERFRREAVTATQLRHKNVVAIFDVGISAAYNVPYILMELAEGFSLRQIINEYKILPLDFVVTVTAQVCSALDEANRLGIVHRDIKPENIIAHQTTTGWQIKILDFGIAKLYNQADIGLTQDGSAMGTPQYMSPEQCMGEQVDGRSDVYSLGIVLYEMLCGTVPFKAPTASAIAVYQVQQAPPSPRSLNQEIHPEVESVLLKSLAKHPNDRQRTAAQLSAEFIKAATVAFKAGFASISPTPIAAPDVEPEFDAIAKPEAPIETTEAAPMEVLVPEIAAAPLVLRETGEVEAPLAAEFQPEEISLIVPDPRSTGEFDVESLLDERSQPVNEDLSVEHSTEPIVAGVVSVISTVVASDSTPIAEEPVPEPIESLHDFQVGTESTDELMDVNAELDDPEIDETDGPDGEAMKAAVPEISEELKSAEETEAGKEEPVPEFYSERIDDSHRKRTAMFAGGIGAVILIFVAGIGAGVWFFSDTAEKSQQTATDSNTAGKQDPTTSPAGMAYVPGGEFMMGSDIGDEYSRPAHKVVVKPFFIDLTEVTNEEYKKFVDATGHKPPTDWQENTFPEGKGRFPVTSVNWDDTNAYAKWAKKRLPTEAEWEFAARGTDGRIYPWGNDWDAALANAGGKSKGMREVGNGGKSPFGLFDLVGNAWEWTSDEARPYAGGKDLSGSYSDPKIIRGGTWDGGKEMTVFYRRAYGATKELKYQNTGFRCAKDVSNP